MAKTQLVLRRWEYCFVACSPHEDEWRPRFINGQELSEWWSNPPIYDYANHLGSHGWEMVSINIGHDQEGVTTSYRVTFKRLLLPSKAESS